jgi:hypothetical protein
MDWGVSKLPKSEQVKDSRNIAAASAGVILLVRGSCSGVLANWPIRIPAQSIGSRTASSGEHLGIYHVGTIEKVTIAELARRIAGVAGREIELLVAGNPAPGGTARRCPDISKLTRLGYKPRVLLSEGLKPTLDWYWHNAELAPKA